MERMLLLLSTLLALSVSAGVPQEALALHLRADRGVRVEAGRVAAWADEARGVMARQADKGARPALVEKGLSGKPAIRFAGKQALSLGQPESLRFEQLDTYTIAVVFQAKGNDYGTLLCQGGGPTTARPAQLYVTAKNVGVVVGGPMHETARDAESGVAVLLRRGGRCEVWLNGQRIDAFAAAKPPRSSCDVLIGARRAEVQNTGLAYALRGDIAEVLVYGRALSDRELGELSRELGGRYGFRPPRSLVDEIVEAERAGADLFPLAEKARRLAEANRLDDAAAEAAARLLHSQDPFVRGITEWALAMKVGGENNKQDIVWPRKAAPEWFAAWQAVATQHAVVNDWVRQAVSRGLHVNPKALQGDLADIVARLAHMRRDWLRHGAELARLAQAETALLALAQRMGNAPRASRQLWLEARMILRPLVLAHPLVDFEQLVCVERSTSHTTRNITRSYPWKHKPGGDICRVSWKKGEADRLLAGRLGPGFVWGMDLWWDGDRVVFGYSRLPKWPPPFNTATANGEGQNVFRLRELYEPLHIFELNLATKQVEQLTDDPVWNDFEPTYLANGDVVFSSDRCARAAECGNVTYDHLNPNLYLREAATGRVRHFTDNKDIDRYPHSLDDGRVGYTHWEYQERHFMEVHALWSARPDGTQSDALFKHHMRAPLAMRDVRSIPGVADLVATATGHHTFAFGPIVRLRPAVGLNSIAGLEVVTPGVRPQEGAMAGKPVPGGGVRDGGGLYQTPWALSPNLFLAAYAYRRPKCTGTSGADANGFGIYVIDSFGNRELLHRNPLLSACFPIPLRPRKRPPIIPSVVEQRRDAVCLVSDVYDGLRGVKRGTVRYLRISQHVGWPFDNERGQMDYIPGTAGARHTAFASWSPVRVLGTVPVEKDGSAQFTIPADTAVYFHALDEKRMEIRRMRSVVSLKAGETRGCRGCHESQAAAPTMRVPLPLAAIAPPESPEPPAWGSDRLLGYEWLVQPILGRNCIRCHGAQKPAGGIDFSATRAKDGLLQSFRTMVGLRADGSKGKRLVSVSNRFGNAAVSGVKAFGSHRSPLATTLLQPPHRKRVQLPPTDWEALVTWIDANAPYYDTFLNKRPKDGGASRREVAPKLVKRVE